MAQAIKSGTTAKTMEGLANSVNSKKINEWQRFLELAEEQKNHRTTDKGVQIFLDTDIKKQLEKLKLSGLNYPVRYLLNAAVRTFLEANENAVNEQIATL